MKRAIGSAAILLLLAACSAARKADVNPGPSYNELFAVGAHSSTNVWAVGQYQDAKSEVHTLTAQWDGGKWLQVPSPNAGLGNHLKGVSIDSSTDGWAVGSYHNVRTGATDTLTLHWNGASWSKVSSPSPSVTNSILDAVSAVSPTDAWAVGSYENAVIVTGEPLILHWDGNTWSQVTSVQAARGTGEELLGVSADSATDAWAVGYQLNARAAPWETLILHWNGEAWSKVASPNPSSTFCTNHGCGNFLSAVSSASATDAWAVGWDNPDATTTESLVLRWDGTNWARVRSPSPKSGSQLFGVSAISATDGWAVGNSLISSRVTDTLVLHWDGTRWSRVISPDPSTALNVLHGAWMVSASDAWAVGRYCASGCGANAEVDKTLVLHWDGTAWSKG